MSSKVEWEPTIKSVLEVVVNAGRVTQDSLADLLGISMGETATWLTMLRSRELVTYSGHEKGEYIPVSEE